MLLLERGGFRPLELVIGGLVAVIGVCYLAELFIAPPEWAAGGRRRGAATAARPRSR